MRAYFFTPFVLIALGILAGQNALGAADELTDLSAAEQDEIGRLCLPVQYQQGAAAYRNCVNSEFALRSGNSAPAMANLSFDDKYAVQQACSKAGRKITAEYQACVQDQITALEREPVPLLEDLSDDERYALQQTCFSAQSREGAGAYRRCVNNELADLHQVPAANLSGLSVVQRNALQLRCSAIAPTAATYRECLTTEYQSVSGLPATFLPESDTESTSEQVQTTARSNATSLPNTETRPQITVAPPLEKTEITTPLQAATEATQPPATAEPSPDIVSEKSTSAASTMAFPRRIKPPGADDITAELTADASTLEAVPTAADVSSTAEVTTRVISRPELVSTLTLLEKARSKAEDEIPNGISDDVRGETGPETGADQTTALPPQQATVPTLADSQLALVESTNLPLDTGPAVRSVDPAETAPSDIDGLAGTQARDDQPVRDWIRDKTGALTATTWIVIATALAASALLLALLKAALRTRRAEVPPLSERVGATMQRRDRRTAGRQSENTTDFLDDRIPLENPSAKDDIFVEDTTFASNDAAVTKVAHKANPGAQPRQTTNPQMWQSGFGHWLSEQPGEEQNQYAIEFLIYWIAYSDDRFDPASKQRIFSEPHPDEHELIKRWVLKQDVFAFADTISWLRSNANQQQRVQILDLLMALLVAENALTPVQNTVLRFLSDAFSLGDKALDTQYRAAFGHGLPPITRPDKIAWWNAQQTPLVRWDARAQSHLPAREHYMARLGLEEEHTETDIIKSFRRAARRCHPDRFSALTHRERSLAEIQSRKFIEARDALLGVSV